MKYRTSYKQAALGPIGLFTFLWATLLGAEPIKEVRSQSGATFDAEVVAENLETVAVQPKGQISRNTVG